MMSIPRPLAAQRLPLLLTTRCIHSAERKSHDEHQRSKYSIKSDDTSGLHAVPNHTLRFSESSTNRKVRVSRKTYLLPHG